jgi:hypothetical protein
MKRITLEGNTSFTISTPGGHAIVGEGGSGLVGLEHWQDDAHCYSLPALRPNEARALADALRALADHVERTA